MNQSTFEKLIIDRSLTIERTLVSKGEEYAPGSDNPFHNFDECAKINDITAEQALWGFMMKHFISIKDMVSSASAYSPEVIDEKIGDMINYLILLEGIMKRSHDKIINLK